MHEKRRLAKLKRKLGCLELPIFFDGMNDIDKRAMIKFMHKMERYEDNKNVPMFRTDEFNRSYGRLFQD